MAYTVWGAFDTFRKNYVDLDATETTKARSSRDFLIGQLNKLDGTVVGFPKLTKSSSSLYFGSFARKTKILPLNDIDFFIILNSAGTAETQALNTSYRYWLKMTDKNQPLSAFLDNYGYVNSTRVLNKISSSLSSVSYYSKAEVKKTHQAVTVNLSSYPWVFDVVPAVAVVSPWDSTITHYLIPDGTGEWMRTDPRKDSQKMTSANVSNNGSLLSVMRLLKYWNNRTYDKSRLSSYYFETLVLNTFSGSYGLSSIQSYLLYFFKNAPLYLSFSCADPKGLGPNLDADVSQSVKTKISTAMATAAQSAEYAIMYENQKDDKNAIYWWGRVFGPNFPSYG